MGIYFCTSCGESQPDTNQFCENCGVPIAAATPSKQVAGATVRLGDEKQGDATGRSTGQGAFPPTQVIGTNGQSVAGTVAVPPASPRAGGRARLATVRTYVVSGVVLAVVALALVLGAPMAQRLVPSGKLDRMITLEQSPTGAFSMVLMRSDGSNKVTLADEPAPARLTSTSQEFYVLRLADESSWNGQAVYNSSPGAVILAKQQRIVFWYPTSDGVEIRSVDVDGGDEVTLARASAAVQLVVSHESDKVLITEDEGAEATLKVVDLRGQATALVQNVPDVGGMISPDGRHVAYWQRADDGMSALTVTDATGAERVEVARELSSIDAMFSPDSSKLFIRRSDSNGSSFQVADANGANLITLSKQTNQGLGQVANGRLIYQLQNGSETSLFSSALSGDDRVELARGADFIQWNLTPDQRSIVFAEGRNGRVVLQMSDLRNERVKELQRSNALIQWDYLDDGRLVLYQHSSYDYQSGEISVSTIKSDGTDEQVLKRGLYQVISHVQGPDILIGGQEDSHGALYLMEGDEPVLLDDEADSYPALFITPDNRVVFTASYGGGPATYSIDRQGKQRRLLAEGGVIIASGL